MATFLKNSSHHIAIYPTFYVVCMPYFSLDKLTDFSILCSFIAPSKNTELSTEAEFKAAMATHGELELC